MAAAGDCQGLYGGERFLSAGRAHRVHGSHSGEPDVPELCGYFERKGQIPGRGCPVLSGGGPGIFNRAGCADLLSGG